MTERSLPEDARNRASTLGGGLRCDDDDQDELWRRFNDASRAFYLLVDTGRPERLEQVAQVMDERARKLA